MFSRKVLIITAELIVLIALIAAFVWYRGDAAPTTEPGAGPITAPITAWEAPETIAARAALESLRVAGRAPRTGYERDKFGQRWSDDVTVTGGHNGCDTRNDILRRDLTDPIIKDGTFGCVVLRGTLPDPYSGALIPFVRGQDTSSKVQIDHVVALADAWQKGAQSWDEVTRRNFANDPRNLLAVDGELNQQKGAADAATWLPPNRSFRCEYARTIIDVKSAYGHWVTAAEKEALGRQLDTC